jgi:hypothetical protein
MLQTAKRTYALADFTVERRPKGWYFTRTARYGDRAEWRGPYSSIASVTLMVARELSKEITRRDARYNVG